MPGRIRVWLYVAVLLLSSALLLVSCGSQAPEPTEIASPPAVRTSPALAVSPTSPPEDTTYTPVAPATIAPQPEDTATVLPTPTTAPLPISEGDGNADIVHVRAVGASDGSWTFYVTVQHPDTGWDDYADGWDVVTPDGIVLKSRPDDTFTRLLTHPHVEEQPFTRSQSGLLIPEGVSQVRVRAHDLVDGFGGREVVVDLTASSGPDFEVEVP